MNIKNKPPITRAYSSLQRAQDHQSREDALRARRLHAEALGLLDLFELSDNGLNDHDERPGYVTLEKYPLHPQELGDKSQAISGTIDPSDGLVATTSNGGRIKVKHHGVGLQIERTLKAHHNDSYLDTHERLQVDSHGNLTYQVTAKEL